MKILMRTLATGPDGTLHAGKVYDLPPAQANAFIEGGYATKVAEPVPAQPIERAEGGGAAKGRRERATAPRGETARELADE